MKHKTKNSIRLPGKSNTIIRKKSGTKISIDGSADNKIKLEKTENPRPAAHSINKISIISRPKDKRFTFSIILKNSWICKIWSKIEPKIFLLFIQDKKVL